MSYPIKLVFGSTQTAPTSVPFAIESATHAPKGAAMRELAHNGIKRRIMACEFRPGELLNEAQFDVLLGLGRTPIHQALHRLEVKGLIQVLPRKGMLVTPPLLNGVLDMIEVRVTNGVLCVTLAAERAHPADFDAVRVIVDASPALIEYRDIAALTALDLKFHLAISAASRSHVLAELLRGLHEKQARFWFLSLSEPRHLQNVYGEHLAMLDALRRRDVLAACEAIREHVDEFRRTIIHAL